MASSQPPNIEDFEIFLESNLPKGSKVLSYTTKYLTKPGDNYGSCMLGVTAYMQNFNGSKENLEIIVKMPPTNELYWKFFKPERTCITENAIYTELIPAIKMLEKEACTTDDMKCDVFPKCYGSRISLLSDANIVDKDAVLILENLIPMGYKVADRLKSLDHEHTLITLKNLAKFHALPIALRKMKPKIFNQNIMPYIQRYDMNENFEKPILDEMIENSLKDIKTIKEFNNQEFLNKITDLIDYCCKYMANPDNCEDSLFSTVAHYDFWVNNMMFLYDDNNKPIKLKILDFQISQYESLAHDVLFFIFSSVQSDIINEKFDDILLYYYDELLKSLEAVGFTTSEYSFDKFMNEIKRLAPIQFFHILAMLKVIFIEKHSLPDDFKDLDTNMLKNENAYSETYFNKLKEFLKFYQKRGFMEFNRN